VKPRLQHVSGGCYAWLQPNGGWGLSNAGLILAAGESLLVDTLFDLPHTQRMLDSMAPLTAAAPIGTLVNTHGNGDHWFGNELVPAVEIIAAAGTVQDMREVGPAEVAALLSLPGITGDYVRDIFGQYQFQGIKPRYPTRIYRDESSLRVGGVDVVLIDVGPAHSRGDTIVYSERDRVVYTGDIVFAGGTPIVWAGPFANWIAACERILALGADLIVPGHGPVCPVANVAAMVDYLQYIWEQASSRFAAGLPADQAARQIDLGRFAAWPQSERLAVNVAAVYRELAPTAGAQPGGPAMFGCLAELQTHRLDAHQPGTHRSGAQRLKARI
jgi:cyclase